MTLRPTVWSTVWKCSWMMLRASGAFPGLNLTARTKYTLSVSAARTGVCVEQATSATSAASPIWVPERNTARVQLIVVTSQTQLRVANVEGVRRFQRRPVFEITSTAQGCPGGMSLRHGEGSLEGLGLRLDKKADATREVRDLCIGAGEGGKRGPHGQLPSLQWYRAGLWLGRPRPPAGTSQRGCQGIAGVGHVEPEMSHEPP